MPARCWICGLKAESSEHIFKKSDIVRTHGRGPYFGPSALAHIRGGVEKVVQGPDSKSFKYTASLCHNCNTTLTQPFDQAYDTFVVWLDKNESLVLKRRFVDFSEIYGPDFENGQRNLYKYFAKSFGCRLADAGIKVPADIVTLFGLESFQTALLLSFAVNEDVLILPAFDRRPFIGKGELLMWAPKDEPSCPNGFDWDEHISWFTICYWYNRPIDGRFGSTWVADSQFVYLGSFAPLGPEMRVELQEKARKRTPQ